MSYFPKRPYYIGIDAEKSTAKMAAVRPSRLGWRIVQLKEQALMQGVKLLAPFPKHAQAITLIESKEVMIRSLTLPLKREKQLRAALAFQALNLLPYPANQAILDYEIQEVREGKTTLNLLAVKKERIEKHLHLLASFSCFPQKVVTPPLALAALSTLLDPAPQLLISIGEKEVCCALTATGKLLKSYTFAATQTVAIEVKKVVLALAQLGRSYAFDTIVLFGHATEELRHAIQEATEKQVQLPVAPQLLISQEKLTSYGLAIGAAMTASSQANFLRDEYAPAPSMHTLRRPLALCAAGIALLSALLITFGTLSIARQKNYVRAQFEALIGKDTVHFKTAEQYRAAAYRLSEELSSRPDSFPLLPAIPTVSECLSWLSHHSSIELRHVQYAMVKHPTLSSRHEHYCVKVSLEFTAKDGKAFVDALEADTSWVDHSQSVVWNTAKDGSYHASFFLKDKTRYS